MKQPLVNITKNITISEEVINPTHFFGRLKGLLGEKTFCEKKSFLIKNCQSIHTFFMIFSIDVVFVNKNMIVESIYKKVPPQRLIFPIYFKTLHVFEFLEGTITEKNISVGDQLNVGY